MKKTKRLAFNVFSLILTFIMTVCVGAFFGCNSSASKSDTLAFNDNMQFTFYVNETIDLTEMVDWPEGERAVLKAEYEEDGQIKQYSKVALTFKPTKTGEVTITITCGEQSITEKIAVIEQLPTLLSVDEFTFEKDAVVTVQSLLNGISVLPIGTSVKINNYKFGNEDAISLDGVETITFNKIGTYVFNYQASNSSGNVDGTFNVEVTRPMTANEEDDITNSIMRLGISSVEQVDVHSENSTWSWKVTAHSSGVYGSPRYWISQCSVMFKEPLDLEKYYVEFDVFASENTYEGGVLINYSTGRNQALYGSYQLCPQTKYNDWKTVSTYSNSIRYEEENHAIKPVGMIISVLHKQQGEYNINEVYMLFDNMRICEYESYTAAEEDDFTNYGIGYKVPGITYEKYDNDKAGNSDYCYRLGTTQNRKSSDYAVADVYFTKEYSTSDYAFSFMVKPNNSYELSGFKFGVLYNDSNGLTMHEYSGFNLQPGTWNYFSSINMNIKSKTIYGIRFYLNTVTTNLTDAVLFIDNLNVFERSEYEINDFSNRFSTNQYNDVEFVMEKNDVSLNSDYAWQITGKHFDYFTINFDKTYAFGDSYLTFDIKNVDNFGGKVLAQFIAGDGTVKQDWLFEDVVTTGWTTLSTQADTSVLLANYKAVNLFLWGEDSAKDVKVIIDNVSVKSRDNAEYFGVSADYWQFTENTVEKTTDVKIGSYVGGEKYVQLAKQGGYNNEFVDVDLTLNGTQNADIAIGMRVETPYNYASIYGKQGFYIRFNDGFFTLYGPTFLGTHCGSYNYPNGMENCTKLRVGIINNNNYVQAYLYFMKADKTVIGEYAWTNYNGSPINPEEVKNGSFIIYSLKDIEREFTISDPFGYVPAPKLTAKGMNLDLGAKYADKYLISIDGEQEFEYTNGTYTFTEEGTYVVTVKAVVGETVSEAATIEMIATERPIEILNATDITLTPESDTKGEITFTSPTDSTVTTSGGGKYSMIKIGENLTDEFIKVGFTTPADLSNPGTGDWSVFMANTLGVSGRIGDLNTTNPASYYYNVLSSPYGGGLKLNANGQSVYAAAQPNVSGECLINNGSLTLAPNTKYYYVYGIVDDNTITSVNCNKDYRVYFALLDESGNVINAYHWSKSNAEKINSYFETAPSDSGSFVISSALKGLSRTLTYEIISKEVGLEIVGTNVVAPTITQDGTKISWATGWATSYKYKVDDGEWQTVSETYAENIIPLGVHKVYVQAFNENIVSQIASTECVNTGSYEFGFYGMSNIQFNELTHEKGDITFTTQGQYKKGGALYIKGNYKNEFIKVGFTADSNRIATSNNVGLEIVMRASADKIQAANNTSEFANSVGTYAPRFWNYVGSYVSLSNYDKNTHSDGKYASNYYTAAGFNGISSGLTKGQKYYICAGIITENSVNTAYWILMDKDSNILKITSYDLDAFNKDYSKTLNESGWFGIYSYRASEDLTYEIVEGKSLVNSAIAFNAANSNITYDSEKDTTTAKLTANSTATSRSAAYLTDARYYTDKFAKVGFTAVEGNFSAQKISLSMRSSSLGVDPVYEDRYTIVGFSFAEGLGIYGGGCQLYAKYTDTNSSPYYGDVVYGSWSSMLSADAFNKDEKCFVYFGAVGSYTAASEGTEATDVKMYFALSKVIAGVETVQFVVEFSYIDDVLTTIEWAKENSKPLTGFPVPKNNGRLVLYSWSTTEKTFTYQIVDNSTILGLIDATE